MSIFGGLPLGSSLIANTVSKGSPLKRSNDKTPSGQKIVGEVKSSIGKIAEDSAMMTQKALSQSLKSSMKTVSQSALGGVASKLTKPGAVFQLPDGTSIDGLPAVIMDDITVNASRGGSPKTDRRVRLKALVGREEEVYGPNVPSNPMAVLHRYGGLLFPYTPTIAFNQDVDYRSSDLTHTNYDVMTYNRTPSVTLTVTGKFSVQNQTEGRYVVAVTHFLRTVSKMYFGVQDAEAGLAGLPPPILMFDGYGNHMFNNLRCVLRSHSYTLDESADYVDVYMEGGSVTRVPSIFNLTLTLTVTRSPSAQKDVFSLERFRRGELMNNRGGWL